MRLLPLLVIGVLMVTQCGTDGSGSPTGYRLGLEKGSADRAAGLSCTPTRYEAEYSRLERDSFARGYLKGYEREGR